MCVSPAEPSGLPVIHRGQIWTPKPSRRFARLQESVMRSDRANLRGCILVALPNERATFFDARSVSFLALNTFR